MIVMESLLLFQPPLAPCKPENISIDQNCSSNAMTVTWNQRSTTQNYTVEATSASGVNFTCDSTESSCCFLDLSCGQLYTFTVMGYTNVCMSEMSTPVDKLTGKLNKFTITTISQIVQHIWKYMYFLIFYWSLLNCTFLLFQPHVLPPVW